MSERAFFLLERAAVNNLPQIVDSRSQLMVSLITGLTAQLAVGLIKAISQIVAAIPQIIAAIIQDLESESSRLR